MSKIEIIKRPLITEKNTYHAEKNTYVFKVDSKSTKPEIRKAVEVAFGVKVVTVRTAICRDRARRTAKNVSKVNYWKKAMVQIAEGQKIKLFEGA